MDVTVEDPKRAEQKQQAEVHRELLFKQVH